MKRVTPKSLQERQNNKNKYADLPKLKDILVDLSVKNSPKVVRKLRLVGPAMEFSEIQDKKRIQGGKGTERVPFPDAHKNSSPTRIGHDDPSKCPWREMGYIPSRRFAQRCLEEQEDGTWVHKILVKGPAVFDFFFDWEEGRRTEGDPDIPCFLGGDVAPPVKIQAILDQSKLGDVDYKVFDVPKDMPLTEELINLLRKVNEPSADDMNAFRNDYMSDYENDPSMPEWRDYFEYGHDIRRIFKFTPPIEDAPEDASEDSVENEKVSSNTQSESVSASSESVDTDLDLDGIDW